ncbi:uncharacterized protein BDV14DRAFT_197859 [Aspergillus stella-maris]|uniref:uncharacterized protein n=1 Tax=Aspergillus stella-maris TaxID=1810926 RepID=UPI003CCD5ABE
MGDHFNFLDPKYDEKELGMKLNLNSLPDPPTDFKPLGVKSLSAFSRNHQPTKAEFKKWFAFYSWGMEVDLKKSTIAYMEAGIRKILFYTAKEHQPKKWDEFNECKRDAGPRLIDYTKIPWNKGETELKELGLWYSPVSRFYPRTPARSARPSDDFVRPADAPRHWRDTWVEQAHVSSGPSYNSNVTAGGLSKFTLELTRGNGLTQEIKDTIQEKIERAIIDFAYQDLQRHPSVAASFAHPPRYVIASSPDNLLQATIGSFPAVSQVQLFEDDNGTLSINRGPSNQPWAMRGRGPACSKDTAVLGCMITVGKLLDAGSTNADRKDPDWYLRLTLPERAFVELCTANWDLCTLETGDRMIRNFQLLLDKDDFGDSSPESIGLLWDAVARRLGQVLIEYEETTILCDCVEASDLGAPDLRMDITTHYMAPPFWASDSQGVTMQTLFERTFDPSSTAPCDHCGKDDGTRVKKLISRLPLRLAVRIPPETLVLDHTKNITFTYREVDTVSKAKDVSATYRWLGGIYCDNGSYRIFWNDTKIGEVDNNHVCIYDGSNYGLIAAGKPASAFQLNGRVPERWWRGKPIPLVFYERIVNTSSEILAEALHTVGKMWTDTQKGNLTLDVHQPWPPTLPAGRPRIYPWKPVISKAPDAEIYHLAPGAYVPTGQEAKRRSGRSGDRGRTTSSATASSPGRRRLRSSSYESMSVDADTLLSESEAMGTAAGASENMQRDRKRRRRS